MDQRSPEIQFVRDLKSTLSSEEVSYVKRRIRRDRIQWTMTLAVLAGFSLIWITASVQFVIVVLAIWGFGQYFIYRRQEKILAKNTKLITVGMVSARYTRDDEGSDRGIPSRYYLELNGKTFSVEKSVYELYYKRDVAEFHYLEDDSILNHKLLKRE